MGTSAVPVVQKTRLRTVCCDWMCGFECGPVSGWYASTSDGTWSRFFFQLFFSQHIIAYDPSQPLQI